MAVGRLWPKCYDCVSCADSNKPESHLRSSWELEGFLDELCSDLDEAMANKSPITSDNKHGTHVFFSFVLYRSPQKTDQDYRLRMLRPGDMAAWTYPCLCTVFLIIWYHPLLCLHAEGYFSEFGEISKEVLSDEVDIWRSREYGKNVLRKICHIGIQNTLFYEKQWYLVDLLPGGLQLQNRLISKSNQTCIKLYKASVFF